ncbi:MAG: amino acid-binding protein [Lachnoclostridium sp.]|nr:amino acid-binding protein [Lachnoclostridium sp.]
MLIKQLSVFMENRQGRLEEVSEVLSKNEVNITSFSLADTSEYGLLRMIVDHPMRGKNVLKEAGFSAMLSDVIAVHLPHEVGALNRIMKVLQDENIEYIYVLATGDHPSLIIKTDNLEKTAKNLEDNNFSLFGEEAYTINQ